MGGGFIFRGICHIAYLIDTLGLIERERVKGVGGGGPLLLAVTALRVWMSAALVPADVILLPALFPDTESPDGERKKWIGARSGLAMCGVHHLS